MLAKTLFNYNALNVMSQHDNVSTLNTSSALLGNTALYNVPRIQEWILGGAFVLRILQFLFVELAYLKITFSQDVSVRIVVVVSKLQKVLEEVHVFNNTRFLGRQDFTLLFNRYIFRSDTIMADLILNCKFLE